MICVQSAPSGTIRDMSPERRPRIPEDLGVRIDAIRGATSFESFVRDRLSELVTTHAEKDPKGMWRVVGEGGAVIAKDLPKRRAETHAKALATLAQAYNTMLDLMEQVDGIEFYDEYARYADRLHKMGDEIAARYLPGPDPLKTGIPAALSPSTGKRPRGVR